MKEFAWCGRDEGEVGEYPAFINKVGTIAQIVIVFFESGGVKDGGELDIFVGLFNAHFSELGGIFFQVKVIILIAIEMGESVGKHRRVFFFGATATVFWLEGDDDL